jgi:hypothetical protein
MGAENLMKSNLYSQSLKDMKMHVMNIGTRSAKKSNMNTLTQVLLPSWEHIRLVKD